MRFAVAFAVAVAVDVIPRQLAAEGYPVPQYRDGGFAYTLDLEFDVILPAPNNSAGRRAFCVMGASTGRPSAAADTEGSAPTLGNVFLRQLKQTLC